MKVIITIPAYNEEKTIGRVVAGIHGVMKRTRLKYEVLVVDDGSRDRTAEVAKTAGAVVVAHPHNLGLAEAFRTEMKACLERKADLVVGSRFKGKIEYMPLVKRLGNKAFSQVISRITGLRISDGQTGFRAFTKEVAAAVPVISTHTYTQETVIRAARQKFRIKEVPVYFAKRDGKSLLISNPLEYAVKAWINIFRIIVIM